MNWSENEVIDFLRRMVVRSEVRGRRMVRGPWSVVRGRKGHGAETIDHRPQTASHGPQTTDHGPQTTSHGPQTTVDIGDDTAVLALPRGHELLVTTDLFVESVHFRRDWLSAQAAGRRALARAASDIAAMGGTPVWAFLSLALPQGNEPPDARVPGEIDRQWIFGFLRGFAAEARRLGIRLAGGDTGSSGSPVFLADVMICGTAPAGRAVLRSGARPGDVLFVSGRLGATAAALAAGKPLPAIHPRLELGRYLREHRLASAMIDLSDGLSTDLGHLCQESGAGAEIEAARIPAAGTLPQALHGGEDYELLFTVPAKRAARVPRRLAGLRLTAIGKIVKGRHVYLLEDGGRKRLAPAGWEHRGKVRRAYSASRNSSRVKPA